MEMMMHQMQAHTFVQASMLGGGTVPPVLASMEPMSVPVSEHLTMGYPGSAAALMKPRAAPGLRQAALLLQSREPRTMDDNVLTVPVEH